MFMKVEVTGESERLIRAALASGRYASASEFITTLIRRWQPDSQDTTGRSHSDEPLSAYDLFAREGVIGCMSDGPTDLATNPEHMEGFGQ